MPTVAVSTLMPSGNKPARLTLAHCPLAFYIGRVMQEITNPKVAWALIFLSGALEIVFATSVQLSNGFTRFIPAASALVFGALSVYLMSLSLKVIPIGTAYAVWGGIGAVGTVVIGLAFFGEPASIMRLLCIGLIVAGVAGLQLNGAT